MVGFRSQSYCSAQNDITYGYREQQSSSLVRRLFRHLGTMIRTKYRFSLAAHSMRYMFADENSNSNNVNNHSGRRGRTRSRNIIVTFRVRVEKHVDIVAVPNFLVRSFFFHIYSTNILIFSGQSMENNISMMFFRRSSSPLSTFDLFFLDLRNLLSFFYTSTKILTVYFCFH